jgi:hypothetical protein
MVAAVRRCGLVVFVAAMGCRFHFDDLSSADSTADAIPLGPWGRRGT